MGYVYKHDDIDFVAAYNDKRKYMCKYDRNLCSEYLNNGPDYFLTHYTRSDLLSILPLVGHLPTDYDVNYNDEDYDQLNFLAMNGTEEFKDEYERKYMYIYSRLNELAIMSYKEYSKDKATMIVNRP